jgi:cbb3-type cytochrome oxidase subunit 3
MKKVSFHVAVAFVVICLFIFLTAITPFVWVAGLLRGGLDEANRSVVAIWEDYDKEDP